MLGEYQLYLGIGIIGTVVFFLRLIMMLFDYMDGELNESFDFFSLMSISVLLLSTGWSGLFMRFKLHMEKPEAISCSITFGLIMSIISFLFIRRLK